MIGRLVAVTLPGFVLGAVIMAVAARGVAPEIARARWLKLGVFFLIVHFVLGVAAAGRPWVALLMATIVMVGARELGGAWRLLPRPRPRRVWAVYLAVAVMVILASWMLPPGQFAFLYIVTATCDGFSQVVGQWLGRRKLAPRLSPGKTVEGLVGGLVAAASVAVLTRALLGGSTIRDAALLGVLAGLAGLAGDLAASWVKRRAGLKDYSDALPGQGGFLDRFDSLLGALAVVGAILAIAAP